MTCYLAEGLHKSVQAPASQFLTCVLAIFLLFLRFFGARGCRKSNLSQLEDCKTSWRKGPRTGESWGDSGGDIRNIGGFAAATWAILWIDGRLRGARVAIWPRSPLPGPGVTGGLGPPCPRGSDPCFLASPCSHPCGLKLTGRKPPDGQSTGFNSDRVN